MVLTDTSAKDVAAGAVGRRGPWEFLTAWFIVGAFVIITSSIGLVGTLLLLPLVLFMLALGVAWLAFRKLRGP